MIMVTRPCIKSSLFENCRLYWDSQHKKSTCRARQVPAVHVHRSLRPRIYSCINGHARERAMISRTRFHARHAGHLQRCSSTRCGLASRTRALEVQRTQGLTRPHDQSSTSSSRGNSLRFFAGCNRLAALRHGGAEGPPPREARQWATWLMRTEMGAGKKAYLEMRSKGLRLEQRDVK
jgi:hypothetical protein